MGAIILKAEFTWFCCKQGFGKISNEDFCTLLPLPPPACEILQKMEKNYDNIHTKPGAILTLPGAILTMPGKNCGLKMMFLMKFWGVLVI